MKVSIYQIKDLDNSKYAFMPWRFAEKYFDLSDYEKVYEYTTEKFETLDMIFTKFNINLPEDFTGHSLSVSDIVELDNVKYYCDSYDWKQI